MTKAPGSLQELRRRIYRKAKSETTHRFWGLFVHIAKIETLEEAGYEVRPEDVVHLGAGSFPSPGSMIEKFRDVEVNR